MGEPVDEQSSSNTEPQVVTDSSAVDAIWSHYDGYPPPYGSNSVIGCESPRPHQTDASGSYAPFSPPTYGYCTLSPPRRSPSPLYSPTSPQYSPFSPHFNPDSPVSPWNGESSNEWIQSATHFEVRVIRFRRRRAESRSGCNKAIRSISRPFTHTW